MQPGETKDHHRNRSCICFASKFESVSVCDEDEDTAPYNDQITVDAFAGFSDEEVHVWVSHADAHNAHGYALKATSNRKEAPL